MDSKPRTTLKRIAAELGVSPMTVSNAYNRPDQLSAELRERVFETARRLGYAGPDPLGRGLRRGRSGAIGVLYDTPLSYAFEDPAAVLFLRGLSSAVEEVGMGLWILPGSYPGERDAATVGGAMCDGIVVYSVAEGDPLVEAALERRLAAVIVDQPRIEGVPFVGIDDEKAARTAAEHLLALGHRHFGIVSFGLSPDGRAGIADADRQLSARYPVSRARLAGYTAAISSADATFEATVYECQGSRADLGKTAARVLLSRKSRPTAILATSDQLGLGVISAAREMNLSVPDDLSVVGFDDTPEAVSAVPSLTTIHQDHAEKGLRAGRLLLAKLRGETSPGSELLPTRLVVRDSTAPAPK
ncbi:MAG TPA: substrate-binding domain-containing protein [Rubrobacteraceae bacterium]|nr:substrate-binding domain-containing protein [Rubrobacteraceae bacterium]